MALWRMDCEGTQVRLTYVDHPTARDPVIQKCVQADVRAVSELEAWMFDRADPWDLCRTADGLTFVRQALAMRGAVASA